MAQVPLVAPRSQYFDNSGNPLSGGKIYFYSAGTSTPKNTYTDSTGGTPNANPVVLDSYGRAPIWGSGSYKVVVKDSSDVTISTDDNYTSFQASTSSVYTTDAFFLADSSDNTKRVSFDLSGISTASTTVVTVPDGNFTIMGLASTQTMSNKTSRAFAITGNTDAIQLNITANATQTSNIIDVKQSGGGHLFQVSNAGVTAITGNETISPFNDALALLITGYSAQTQPLIQCKSSGGTSLFKVDASGYVTKTLTTYQATPADPTGTTDTTGKMMGLAGSITPHGSGTIFIQISGSMTQNTNADGGKVQIRYGTSTAPANADALTGTAVGNIVSLSFTTAASARHGWTCNAIVTGLSAGTAYWIDVGLAAITGGTASVKDISISAYEL